MYNIKKYFTYIIDNASLILTLILLTYISVGLYDSTLKYGTGTLSKYEWMASLTSGPTDIYENRFCGAIILNDSWALTAAHCVLKQRDLYVAYDSNYLTDTFKTVKIDKVVIHSSYNIFTKIGDLALLRLTKKIKLNNYPKLSEDRVFDKPFTSFLLGWGTLSGIKNITPNLLQKKNLTVWDSESCAKVYGNLYQGNSVFCAGNLSSFDGAGDGKDACFGDSGGPLVEIVNNKLYIIGIVSWSSGLCDSKTYPTIYTNISFFKHWILTNIETHS